MMVREVIKCLESCVCGGMEGDAVFAGAIEVFEDVEGSFVMLMAGIGIVGGKERKSGGHVGASAGGQPIDASNNTLIAFSAAFEVGIGWIWGRNGIDRNA